ncbi:CHAP domain-containing protein [Streptomyces noursei]|uniref:CHAP domain-containing protein n=1 Tax=Streptomyces noursei TaxID=1971 RepID=UPI000C9AF19F|nr:CHAP domain-containing protein [Streptomyces noursei]
MGQAQNVIDIASGKVGCHEGLSTDHWSNQQKSPAVPGLEFVSWAFRQAGLGNLVPSTASCTAGVQWFKSRDRFSPYPAVGAVVYFGPGGGSHVGIVERYDDTYIYTIEGNANASTEGDGVYKKKRFRHDAYVHGYGYPPYVEGIISADPAWSTVTPLTTKLPLVSLSRTVWAATHNVDQQVAATGPDAPRDDVAHVQEALSHAVGLQGHEPGIFDEKTTDSYRKWQESPYGIGPDSGGVPGRNSLVALGQQTGKFQVYDVESLTAVPCTTPRELVVFAELRPGQTSNSTCVLQKALAQDVLSAYPDVLLKAPEYGRYGLATAEAVAQVQQNLGYRGSDADGVIGIASLRYLADKYHFDIQGAPSPSPGSGAISPGTLSTEFKRDTLALVDFPGRKVTEVAREPGVSLETRRWWYRQAKADNGEGRPGELTSAEHDELKRLRRLAAEQAETIEMLRKATVFFVRESDR